MSVGILHGKVAAYRAGIAPDSRLVAVSILDDHRITGELVAGSFSLTAYRTGSLVILGAGCRPAAILMSVGIFFGEGAADRTGIALDSGLIAVSILDDYRISRDLVVPCFGLSARRAGSLMPCGTG